MDNEKNQLNEELEFDLEDILNEFHDPSNDPLEPEESQPVPLPELSFAPEPKPEEPEISIPEPPASQEPAPESQPEPEPESLPEEPEEPAPETLEQTQVQEDATMVFTPGDEVEAQPEPDADSTQQVPPISQEETPEPQEPPAPIVFNPRARLKDLRKKLVAGPEKRYYELASLGLGRLQTAIILNLIIVAVCAGITVLLALDMVPQNRIRLVIFSQVLAMLLSALLGSHVMTDSVLALFRGRFGVNTLLTITFAACCVDAVFCLQELRVPCCAAFCLEMTMALWARYNQRATETAQMDTMRKAVHLHGITRVENFYEGADGLVQTQGEVEDFMENYNRLSAPELIQSIYAGIALVCCIGIALFTGLLHGTSLAFQVLATSLLVAVPATFFISISRPMAILQTRLHMVGSVICGWQGVKGLCGKLAFPIRDNDLFPKGSTKLNGVKFYGSRSPEETISFSAALIRAAGGGLVNVFQELLESRGGLEHVVENFKDYGGGGIGGEVCGEPVLMGSLHFLQDMGVEIPEGTMVSQAVYAAIDGQLCAVYAISYAKMRSAAAGLVTLSGYRKLTPVMLCGDFMLTEEFIRAKFGIKAKRIAFPPQEERAAMGKRLPNPEEPVLAIATRDELIGPAYAVTGARALATSTRLGVIIHLLGGIVGMIIMLVLGYLGSTELLTPSNVLLYQLIWAIPGLLVTEWMRTV